MSVYLFEFIYGLNPLKPLPDYEWNQYEDFFSSFVSINYYTAITILHDLEFSYGSFSHQ